ncbi:hypothetical protein CCUS01_04770 [Colletotrichum cuscutae]|uniref:Uncharacterized protein n=1 Tax=Colletotrichum cuscutae TaxID=1209917 RepID=A0AAI9VBL8_9PEZI|nr:hypothetical protein CCUS01_04770 [Colletotrichum cuscutae]
MTLRLIIIGTRLQHFHPDTSSFYIKPIIHTISSHVLPARLIFCFSPDTPPT